MSQDLRRIGGLIDVILADAKIPRIARFRLPFCFTDLPGIELDRLLMMYEDLTKLMHHIEEEIIEAKKLK